MYVRLVPTTFYWWFLEPHWIITKCTHSQTMSSSASRLSSASDSDFLWQRFVALIHRPLAIPPTEFRPTSVVLTASRGFIIFCWSWWAWPAGPSTCEEIGPGINYIYCVHEKLRGQSASSSDRPWTGKTLERSRKTKHRDIAQQKGRSVVIRNQNILALNRCEGNLTVPPGSRAGIAIQPYDICRCFLTASKVMSTQAVYMSEASSSFFDRSRLRWWWLVVRRWGARWFRNIPKPALPRPRDLRYSWGCVEKLVPNILRKWARAFCSGPRCDKTWRLLLLCPPAHRWRPCKLKLAPGNW